MFAIYGTSGQMFQGPFEELRKVVPATRTARARSLSPVLDRTDATEFELPHGQSGAAAPQGEAAQALQTYASVQNPVPERHPIKRVAEVMSRDPVLLLATTSVQQAWRLLTDAGVGQAPVVNEQGMLVGLVTRAELMPPDRLPQPGQSAVGWQALLVQPVTEIMLTPVPSVEPTTDIRRLAVVLLDTGLPGLPVVESAGVVNGFVSRSDILRAVVHDPPLDLWS